MNRRKISSYLNDGVCVRAKYIKKLKRLRDDNNYTKEKNLNK